MLWLVGNEPDPNESTTMNKQTVQDVDAALERWHRRLMMAANKIDELRKKRKKMLANKIKVAAPRPVKVMFKDLPFNDDLPDFAGIVTGSSRTPLD
jgi:phage shock protein A